MVCLCDLQESGRAFRWSKDVVHWALTLQFHGGKRIIDDLRGQANAGAGQHGKLKVDVSKWGLFLPANSTLRNYLPPVEVYEGFDQASINQFKTAFPSESPRKVIIAWDEIEIRYGLVWNPSTKELIGKVNGPIAEKSAKEENWLNMSTQLATHVIQFFLVSADGAASVPIGFYPMVSINGNKVFAIIKPLIDMLQAGSDALQVVATASDAFPSNDALIKLLKDSGYNIVHLFDPLHLLKNMRNNFQQSVNLQRQLWAQYLGRLALGPHRQGQSTAVYRATPKLALSPRPNGPGANQGTAKGRAGSRTSSPQQTMCKGARGLLTSPAPFRPGHYQQRNGQLS